eukprot:s3152_g6.t1
MANWAPPCRVLVDCVSEWCARERGKTPSFPGAGLGHAPSEAGFAVLNVVSAAARADAGSWEQWCVAAADQEVALHQREMSAEVLLSVRGTYGTGLALVTRLAPADAAALCVAGVAFGDIDMNFAWQAWHFVTHIDLHLMSQAWHLVTSACTLCGRRGPYGIGLALVTRLAPVDAAALHGRRGIWRAFGDAELHFAWQAWRLVDVRSLLRGNRGAWEYGLSLCVAGVALGDMHLHFVWQAWHLATSTFTLCGRCGTYGTGLAFVMRLVSGNVATLCVAGVACGDMGVHHHSPAGTFAAPFYQAYTKKLEAFFKRLDKSGDGVLTWTEFGAVLNSPKLQNWLATLELESHDLVNLFNMIDDGDGEISLEDFLHGARHLRGPASSIALAEVMATARRTEAKTEALLMMLPNMSGVGVQDLKKRARRLKSPAGSAGRGPPVPARPQQDFGKI